MEADHSKSKIGNALGLAGKEDTWWFIIENNIFKWRWVPAVPYILQVEIELEDENLLDVAVMTALFPSQKSFRFKQKQVGVSSATTLLAFLVVPHLVSNFEDLDFGRRQLEVTAGQLFFDS